MSAFRKLATFTLFLIFSSTVRSETPGHSSNAAAVSRGARAIIGSACAQITGAPGAAATQAQRELARLLISTTALTHRYEELRQRNEAIPVALNEMGRAIARFVQNGEPVGAAIWLSPILSGSLTVAGYVNYLYAGNLETFVFRGLKGFSVGSASLTGSAVVHYSLKQEHGFLLPRLAGEPSLADRDAIRQNLERDLEPQLAQLGEILGWNAAQKARFSRRLHAKVIETLVKSSRELTHDRFVQEVTAGLGAIDFVDFLAEEKLASPDQLGALRDLRAISRIFQQLKQNGDQSLRDLGEQLRRQGPVESHLSALRGLRAGLLSAESGLAPASPARAAVAAQIREITDAIESIQTFCELENLK